MRDLLARTAESIWRERGAAPTWLDMALQAQVGHALARDTVRNMLRSGQLVRSPAAVHMPHARRPLVGLMPAAAAPAERDDASAALAAVMGGWRAPPNER